MLQTTFFKKWYVRAALFVLFLVLPIISIVLLSVIPISALLAFTAGLIGISWIAISLGTTITALMDGRRVSALCLLIAQSGVINRNNQVTDDTSDTKLISKSTAKCLLWIFTTALVLLLIFGIGIAGFTIIFTPAALAYIAALLCIGWMSISFQIGIVAFLTIFVAIAACITFVELLRYCPRIVFFIIISLPVCIICSILLAPITLVWVTIGILIGIVQLVINIACGCLGKYGPFLTATLISVVIGLLVAVSILSLGMAPIIFACLPSVIAAVAEMSLLVQLLTLTACFSFFLAIPNLIIASINSFVLSKKTNEMKMIYEAIIVPVIRSIICFSDDPNGWSCSVLSSPIEDVGNIPAKFRKLTDEMSEENLLSL